MKVETHNLQGHHKLKANFVLEEANAEMKTWIKYAICWIMIIINFVADPSVFA